MKELTVTLDEDVYAGLVERAHGPRKVSRFLNEYLRKAFVYEGSLTEEELAVLRLMTENLADSLTAVANALDRLAARPR